MMMLVTMFALGLLLGFAGGGGSGFVLALLISVFQIPIHTALGTSTTAMIFTVISGSISHFKEGNMKLKTGAMVGAFGAVGAYFGTQVAAQLPETPLIIVSALLLFVSSILLFFRTRLSGSVKVEKVFSRKQYLLLEMGVGGSTGFLSGCFGIGSTPLIQLGLMIFFGLSIQQAAATSMFVLIPISFLGAFGFAQAGFVDIILLVQVVAGTMIGSFIGAKFTRLAPVQVLRTVIIFLPIFGGILLLT
ncbi:hypothetical protein CHI12_11005 [Terribacillus saccharophilus]|uniref:Probable membrane transporter protein n=1 Tax=Terribacillus saccharophilus TaxID=361277 RepID=A0A268HCC7_9BACI|nr:sulfite exporter TauE/SafE family protein [Terribacillus saccharophilus]PAE07490.1 hypothetical protein CHI12_11005 [Terribacillus saccharophilus]